MGYKNSDPCLQKAYDDERLFVLMTRDETAPDVVMEWVKKNLRLQPREKLIEALDAAIEMSVRCQMIKFCKRMEMMPQVTATVNDNDFYVCANCGTPLIRTDHCDVRIGAVLRCHECFMQYHNTPPTEFPPQTPSRIATPNAGQV